MTLLKFIASACLAGVKCRYNGETKLVKKIYQLVKRGKALPLCPEQLSGLSTPRKASQIKYSSGKKKVISISGEDLSQFFLRGANLTYRIAKRFKIDSAYLKNGSPSCGSGSVDKRITTPTAGFAPRREDRRKKTVGITSSLLEKKGMRIFSDPEGL